MNQTTERHRESARPAEWNRAHVLVADDDEGMRALVVGSLTSRGYAVQAEESGSGALKTFNALAAHVWPLDGIELVVLDHRMPGMTGLDVLREIRLAHWDTPAILMTAFPSAEVLAYAAELGATVLAKPFSLDDLTRAAVSLMVRRAEPGPDGER
jgi:two-component system, response regulator, stage 0 sporulation protein F